MFKDGLLTGYFIFVFHIRDSNRRHPEKGEIRNIISVFQFIFKKCVIFITIFNTLELYMGIC